MKKFNNRKFKELRKAKGFTLEEIAKEMGCSYAHVWHIENKLINIKLFDLSKIADILSVKGIEALTEDYQVE